MLRVILLLVCLHAASARANPVLQFTRFSVGEGLPQASVYGLFQDRTGFLWIGTGDGLARYDGQRFVAFRSPIRSASATVVYGPLAEDRWGRIWASSEADIIVTDVRRSRSLHLSAIVPWLSQKDAARPRIIGVDATDTLWVVHADRILGISLRTGGHFLSRPSTEHDEYVTAALTPAGVLYYASHTGLYRYDRAARRGRLVFQQARISALFPLPDGRIAVSKPGSIAVYSDDSPTRVYSLASSPYPAPGAMAYHTQSGTLYFLIGAQGLGSLHLQSGRIRLQNHTPADPLSLSTNLTLTLAIDRSENLWVGTEGGGMCRADLKAPKFCRYPDSRAVRAGATGIMVKSVLKIGDDILFGTFDSGLQVVDARSGAVKARLREAGFEHLASPNSVNILCRDSAGRIWSNIGHLVGRLDARDYHFTPVAAVPARAQRNEGNFSVYTFLACRAGTTAGSSRYLLGTNYGLALLEEGPSSAKISSLSLPSDHYYALRRLPDGTFLAGRLRGGWIRFSLDETGHARILGSGFVTTGIRDFRLASGKHPLVFAASESGLIVSHLLTGTTRVLDERDGLSNAHLYGILAENDTTLWVSTNRGLNRIGFRYAADGMPAAVWVTVYGEEDGLQSAEFNSGAFARAEDGTFLFGGINGINWFRPTAVRANPYPPTTVLTAVAVNEKPVATDTSAPGLRALELPHDKSTLAIRFAALEYTQPGAALYSYKLEGFEDDWTKPSRIAEARYAGLPPGRYTFLLRAANADGVWNPRPLRLGVTIYPPWWATWWARAGAALLLASGVALGIREYVSTRVRRRLREIEKEAAVNDERLRISRDMHDELGSGLTKIALLSEVTKQKMARAQDGRDVGLLEQITATSRILTEKMGEIIWTLNPAADTLDNLAAYVQEYLSELGDGLMVNIAVRMPEEIPAVRLSNRQRQQILLVTKEAVNNAIKHARASCITVSLVLKDGEAVFKVVDDGKGFVPAEEGTLAGKRNGLGNMVARMESVGGWCRIHTTPGGGTAVEYGTAT